MGGHTMTTNELIAELQRQDPSGEIEVVVGNAAILFVSTEGAYYDGPYLKLIKDPTITQYCNVVACHLERQGLKVQIHTTWYDDFLLDDPEFPVTLDPTLLPDYTVKLEKDREEARQINANVEQWFKDHPHIHNNQNPNCQCQRCTDNT
jgi:hypothetical protein